MVRGDETRSTPLTIVPDVADTANPTLVVEGDLDFSTAPQLWAEVHDLLERVPATLTLDVAGLYFVDSTGLALIVQAWRLCQESGAVLGLRSTPRFLQSILRITGVADLLARQTPPVGPTRGSLDGPAGVPGPHEATNA